MLNINRTDIDLISKENNSKFKKGNTHNILYTYFSNSIVNFIDTIRELSVYEMAHWINNNDRWLHNKNFKNIKTYKRGSILHIDLGANNFNHEPSFAHPCIVLANRYDSLLIVPCSSKKYGKGYSDIIDATSKNGFSGNTGIQLQSFRWINKNRVISKVGKVDSAILNRIDEKILEMIPLYRLEKSKNKYLINELTTEIKDLKLELQNANKIVYELSGSSK